MDIEAKQMDQEMSSEGRFYLTFSLRKYITNGMFRTQGYMTLASVTNTDSGHGKHITKVHIAFRRSVDCLNKRSVLGLIGIRGG